MICSKRTDNWLSLLLGISLDLAFLTRHLAIGYLAIALVWPLVSKPITHRSTGITALMRKIGLPHLIVLWEFFLAYHLRSSICTLRQEVGHLQVILWDSTSCED